MTILLLLTGNTYGQQTPKELFERGDFKGLTAWETKADQLDTTALFQVGFAFFRLGEDAKAITFYDKAVQKGYRNPDIHFYKGMSLNYLKKPTEAIPELELALTAEPDNQEFLNEKGLSYYQLDRYDEALQIFEKAKKLPNTFQGPWYYAAHILHLKGQYDQALKSFYEALPHIDKDKSFYLTTLEDIGRLEYTHTHNYKQSIKAYTEALQVAPARYELYTKLIKACNADRQFSKADSFFVILQKAFREGKLGQREAKYKNVSVDESNWKDKRLILYKNFIDPVAPLDISYKVYITAVKSDDVERIFMLERTAPIDDIKYVLCEKDQQGGHYTYPYTWKTEVVTPEEIKKAVILVLEGKMTYGASSNFGK